MTNNSNIIDNLRKYVSKIDFSSHVAETFNDEFVEGLLIRVVENKLLDLFSKGLLSGTVHTCIGQEFSAVFICKHLKEFDWITSNHRCHGHFISKTKDWKALLLELLGDMHGVSKGIGSSQHLYTEGFISNGTQGSLLPVASGMGISKKIKDSDSIVVSYIGEGTLGEGVLYEAMNLSSLYSSRHLIVVENNFYSQSTPQRDAIAGSISKRGEAFDLQIFKADTWDIDNLDKVCKKSVDFVRNNNRPAMLIIETYRLMAHSKGDDDRDLDEVTYFTSKDLISQYVLTDDGIKELHRIEKLVDEFIYSALEEIENYSTDDYFSDQLIWEHNCEVSNFLQSKELMAKALNSAYFKLLEAGYNFIGEDILDPYGGAFKITKGFHDKLPSQVYSTSISEAGLVGIAIGLDLMGEKTCAEIMFGDFLVNASDQLVNNASKFHHMYGKQINSSIIVRTPMGGRRGYGPTHSQSIEKMFLGIDNLAVFAVSSLIDPGNLIFEIDSLHSPKLLIENKVDYGKYTIDPSMHGDFIFEKIGDKFSSLLISPNTGESHRNHISIVSYGGIARLIFDNLKEIFINVDSRIELLVVQQLHPIPLEHIKYASGRTNSLLIVDENSQGFGWSDGVVSKLVNNKINIGNIHSLSSKPYPIASVRNIEEKQLVSIENLISTIKGFIDD